jgi:GNAT superfamily N-acetyltransferase
MQVPAETIEVRLMTEADLAAADELRRLAGWNQKPRDWQRLLTLEPRGCFVALRNGAVVGTVTTTVYGTDLAWIGMMLVHPEHRRTGIASRLMNRALEFLQQRQVNCVRLDATPIGQPVYEKLGFISEWRLQRWQRVGDSTELAAKSQRKHTRRLEERDWRFVEPIDAAAIGAPRPELLRRLGQESRRALVWPVTGEVLGFGFLRPGADSDYLGPLVCSVVDAFDRLLPDLLNAAVHSSLTWDIPDHNEAAKAAAHRFGFKPVRPLMRMRLGRPAEPLQPHTLFGIADPAVG